MMKFFRKHNKKLLAIFMALLMIVFIGGSALQGMLTAGTNYDVANSKHGVITLQDQQAASNMTKLLLSMNMNWRYPAGGSMTPITEMDWILLSKEADTLEHKPDLATVRNFFTPDSLNDLARNFRTRPDHILLAVAQLNAIEQAALAVASATTPSEAEVLLSARNALEKVQVNVVKLTAGMFLDENKEFSESKIQEHFEKYRENESGVGLNFGYYIKPSVKVQYIEINRNEIAINIGVPNLEKKAREYYNQYKTFDFSFRRPAGQMDVEGDGPPPDQYLSWEESKVLAMESVREQHAKDAVNTIANWIIQESSLRWLDVERDDNGYKKTPVEVADLDYYKNISERIPQRINYPDAIRMHNSDFFTEQEAGDVPLIGNVKFRPTRELPQSFGSLAFRSQAAIPKIPTGNNVNPSDYLSIYQTCPYVLINPNTGDAFIFRVVDAKPGHIPDRVDEVRDLVLADMRLADGYREATYAAESIRGWDEAESLVDAYNRETELIDKQKKAGIFGTGYLEPAPFARTQKFAASMGRPAAGVPVGAGVGTLPNTIVDEIFGMNLDAEQFKVIEMPDDATVLVMEWVATTPPMADEFLELRNRLVTELADRRRRTILNDWLNPEQIRARNEFALITNDQ